MAPLGRTKLIMVLSLSSLCSFSFTQFGATTATTLRLCQGAGVFGSNRLVVGDSWFGSLKTAEALAKRGLHFLGVVKTAHSMFPKDKLSSLLKDSSRGEHVTMMAKLCERQYIAVGWKRSRDVVQHFIATCGTTVPFSLPFSDEVGIL